MYKVMLVEDEEMIMKSIQFLVNWTELDCTICGTAFNGREGIRLIEETGPDIVITDIRMPFVDGIEMLRKTKERCGYEALVVSGYNEFDYAQQALKLGVSDYLLKPVDMDEMAQIIRKITARCREKEEIAHIRSISRKGTEDLALSVEDVPTASTKYARYMVDYIKENFAHKISLKDLSEQMGMSVPYLNNKFKEGTGRTFNDYLNHYRIQQALGLMRETDMKIYEIADAVGIPDYKYFNHVFKKYTGVSPSSVVNT